MNNKLDVIDYISNFYSYHKTSDDDVRKMNDDELDALYQFCIETEQEILMS